MPNFSKINIFNDYFVENNDLLYGDLVFLSNKRGVCWVGWRSLFKTTERKAMIWHTYLKAKITSNFQNEN